MQVHSLDFNDFQEDSYTLIGVHTTLEDYKLAYLLNQNLRTNFNRADYNLDFESEKNNASFSVYNYTNQQYDFDWFLIANSFKQENIKSTNEVLFDSEITTYLIPEKKKVDYFIKIIGDVEYSYISKTIDAIQNISQVITSYTIDSTTLKSKDFLIF
ncbi:hypothetical protein OD91_1804 [Lutibacter sp. Hel_I_33_5]|uniref:IPExxxVDY family protein n=1 Tax=Lutibacter sp. Hel_I_33_5 TaxID=1566289 RepID=UPI0011A54D00|nr:IPExxxVDY family protein [Lutibacter sp. Hel_I_33_5]TVZ56518.1 hypothetical protein OD91_1804 [Lutibacter sp. Hel_I_33_5]